MLPPEWHLPGPVQAQASLQMRYGTAQHANCCSSGVWDTWPACPKEQFLFSPQKRTETPVCTSTVLFRLTPQQWNRQTGITHHQQHLIPLLNVHLQHGSWESHPILFSCTFYPKPQHTYTLINLVWRNIKQESIVASISHVDKLSFTVGNQNSLKQNQSNQELNWGL